MKNRPAAQMPARRLTKMRRLWLSLHVVFVRPFRLLQNGLHFVQRQLGLRPDCNQLLYEVERRRAKGDDKLQDLGGTDCLKDCIRLVKPVELSVNCAEAVGHADLSPIVISTV